MRVGQSSAPGWFAADAVDLDEFRRTVDQTIDSGALTYADAVVDNVVVYAADVATAIEAPTTRRELQRELISVLADGPGIVVFRRAVDGAVLGRGTAAFERLIAAQRAAGEHGGDHFAAPGSNDRVWRALDKLAVADPETFVDYYDNDVIALVSEAWLGPGYRITSQVNVVNPGSSAQVAHRDYHLGFMDADAAAAFPMHVHQLSPRLTLQGAIAHVDMPVESGPTLYLPFSQLVPDGYLACHDRRVRDYFDEHRVQLALDAGDAVFFNPALFHAAGANRTADVRRMANLLQVSSAFGKPMEVVDTAAIATSVYPALLARAARARTDGERRRLDQAIVAAAESYAFPSDLDRDQPVDAPIPPTEADLVRRAIAERWSLERFTAAIAR